MILLENYIKYYLLKEQETETASNKIDYSNMTYGDFIDALNLIVKEKNNIDSIQNKKKYGKVAIKTALMLATGGWSEILNSAMDVGDALTTLTQQDDEKVPKGFLGQFDLDQQTSAVADDKVEKQFVEYLIKKFNKNKDQKMPEKFDINEEFNSFLMSQYKRKINK